MARNAHKFQYIRKFIHYFLQTIIVYDAELSSIPSQQTFMSYLPAFKAVEHFEEWFSKLFELQNVDTWVNDNISSCQDASSHKQALNWLVTNNKPCKQRDEVDCVAEHEHHGHNENYS